MREFKRSPSGLFLADSEVNLLRDELQVLAGRALALPLAQHETVKSAEGLRPVVEEACELLRVSADRLSSLAAHMDRFSEATAALRSTANDSGMPSPMHRLRDPGQVSGLCFLARFALLGCLGDLERLLPRLSDAEDEEPMWEAIEAAQSASREVVKAISGVDMALCAATGASEGQPFFVTSVKESLETRHAYITLYESVKPTHPPTAEELVARIRSASVALVKLRGRPTYPWMRVHDRRIIHRVFGQLHGWLRGYVEGGMSAALALDGERLWQECANLSEILLGVNNRQELRAFDHHLLAHLRTQLSIGGDVESLRPHFALVHGRDRELDSAVVEGDAVRSLECVERVLATLDVDPELQARCAGMLEQVHQRLDDDA
ncbi:MAG: hypothetical protein KF915_18220 [Polyangiaceae bacterium]|nr:hypothetical protein [Polyangiaceae bacterium]